MTVTENNSTKKKRAYVYDDYGNIITEKRYIGNNNWSDFVEVSYDYNDLRSVTNKLDGVYLNKISVSGIKDIDRDHVMLTASPQVYKYSLALDCYEKAEKEDKHNFTFTSSLLIHYKERVFFAKGTTSNIKITRKEDLALFEALLSVPEKLLYS